jgi:hypothetical protein
VRTESNADDIVQESYMRAFRGFHGPAASRSPVVVHTLKMDANVRPLTRVSIALWRNLQCERAETRSVFDFAPSGNWVLQSAYTLRGAVILKAATHLSHFAVLIIASVVVRITAVRISKKSIISGSSPKATTVAEAATMKAAGKPIEAAAAETSKPSVKTTAAMKAAAPSERSLTGQHQCSRKQRNHSKR